MSNSLKKMRQEIGITQAELSRISGVSRTTISLIETGALKNIESKTMLKLAIALGRDVGDIFFKTNVVFKQQNKFNNNE